MPSTISEGFAKNASEGLAEILAITLQGLKGYYQHANREQKKLNPDLGLTSRSWTYFVLYFPKESIVKTEQPGFYCHIIIIFLNHLL